MLYRVLQLYNIAELLPDETSSSLALTRIPNDLRMSLNQLACDRASHATGAELRFNLQSDEAIITLCCPEKPAICEVWQGDFLVDWHIVGTEPTEIVVKNPARLERLSVMPAQHNSMFDSDLTRVLLPYRPATQLVDVRGEWTPPRAEQTPTRRLLMYGSSITHGNSAIRPSGCWAHRTAQLLKVDAINLGFGGGAHLEPQMADYLAARDDWEMATLETGINIGGIGRVEFARRIDYFIETIARALPDKWIFCLGVFRCNADVQGEPTFAEFRDEVRRKVESLNMPRLVYLDGLEMGPSLTGLTADLVHPSPAGMEEIARNVCAAIETRLG